MASKQSISTVNKRGSTWYKGGIETWDYIISQNLGYLEGNIVKYITRYRKKNGMEDLEKAKHYLDKLIEVYSKGGDYNVKSSD